MNCVVLFTVITIFVIRLDLEELIGKCNNINIPFFNGIEAIIGYLDANTSE